MMRLANAGSRVCNQEEATYLMSQSLQLRSTKTPFILHQVKFTSHFKLLYGQSRNSKDSKVSPIAHDGTRTKLVLSKIALCEDFVTTQCKDT